MPNFKDLTKKRFGRLLVLSRAKNSKSGGTRWNCICDCGKQKIILAPSLGNPTMSCGCYQKEAASRASQKHGMSKTAEYRAWTALIQRATNLNIEGAKNYSGRGIGVCKRWRNSFDLFFRDMGKRPTPQHSVERINNNKGYYPSNCMWDIRKSQSRNKRSNVIIEIGGVKKCLTDWVEIYKTTRSLVRGRLKRGMTYEEALSYKERLQRLNIKKAEINGVERSVSEWSKLYGITPNGIRYRLSIGWDVEMAITTPSIRPKNNYIFPLINNA